MKRRKINKTKNIALLLSNLINQMLFNLLLVQLFQCLSSSKKDKEMKELIKERIINDKSSNINRITLFNFLLF